MSGERLFELCSFKPDLCNKDYLKELDKYLREVPATVTTKDVELASKQDQSETTEAGVETAVDAGDIGTTPLHMICQSLETEPDTQRLELAHKMMDTLFEFGASWRSLDENNETPGCIALRRCLPESIYEKIVQAGVRSEVLLRRILVANNDDDDGDTGKEEDDTAVDQKAYLSAQLEYTDHELLTSSNKDGVMMDWETPIMEKSAALICKDRHPDGGDDDGELVVVNVGFGMGIIDRFIQDHKPSKHYICEAHPDVLKQMKKDGWYKKPNVVILEGRWQDTLAKLLEEQVYFDGIYYDTFSEHYDDLVDFFDSVVGLLKPTGVFSFFNGLGADRQVCYDVYKHVVEVDLNDYGLTVNYISIPVELESQGSADQKNTWDGIRHQYWTLKEYLLPEIRFNSLE